MDFEALRDAALPAAPRWAPVELDREDALNVARHLIMVVGYNDIARKEQVLGSGFLVATQPELLALTATHVLTEWIDKVRPPRPHAFRGLQGDDDDLKKRVADVVEAGLFLAAIRCRAQGGYRLCAVKGVSLPFDPLNIDVACLRLELPRWAAREDFDSIPINAEICLPGGPMLIAGWAGGEWGLPDLEGHPFPLSQRMVVRAAFNRGPIAAPRGYQNWMFLVDAPSEPGMSGGPLLVMDLLSAPGRVRLSARGVISRDCIAPPADPADEGDPNQTWVSPIEAAFALRCPLPQQILFWEAVRTGLVGSYGQRARQGSVTPGPDEHSLRWDPL